MGSNYSIYFSHALLNMYELLKIFDSRNREAQPSRKIMHYVYTRLLGQGYGGAWAILE